MTTLGYARTSSVEQAAGLAAQERDLRAAGAERIISEQISSVAKRPGLEQCLTELVAGDVLIVTKPDRLARSTAHLLTIVEDLNRRGVGLVLLSMGGERMDTRNPTAKFMLTMLAAVAELERNLMLERQKEGIAKARREGKYKGRKPRIDPVEARRLAAEFGPAVAARELGVGLSSVYRLREPVLSGAMRMARSGEPAWRR
jgi:DNA invertase Pin-like site-specific DNA recombinase